jgi:hypothetical protein
MKIHFASVVAAIVTSGVVWAQDYSGIEIQKDDAAITFGTEGDCAIKRTADETLSINNTLLVQGVDISRAVSGVGGVGGVAWDMSQSKGASSYFKTSTDFELPLRFTIETWVYPLTSAGYFLSWATDTSDNCLLFQTDNLETDMWHHIVYTWDRYSSTVHDNGAVNMGMIHSDFCSDYVGSFVLAQEQDSVGGGFRFDQSASVYVDTVAIYNRVFDVTERFATDKTCVDITDPSLMHLWSGYDRGLDKLNSASGHLMLEGFVNGASTESGISCSNAGAGLGTPGDDYEEYEVSYQTPAVGAVGWVFPGSNEEFHFYVELTLPLDFSIEFWMYAVDSGDGTYILSWASDDDNNCMLLKGTNLEVGAWHHFVVTWDGYRQRTFLDGEISSSHDISSYQFCGDYTGGLSIGQEQDSVGGSFDADQSPKIILDTVAVYSRALDQDDIASHSSACIDLSNVDLFALYSGYSRGKDLVGVNHGIVAAAEILEPGDVTTVGTDYGWEDGEIEFDIETCEAAQEQVGATAPDFTNNLIGGVGWDFLGDTESYLFHTAADFTLPDEFTLEFWIYPRESKGYILSYATEDDNNCLLLKGTQFDSYDSDWYHVLVTVDSDDSTVTYVNGEEDSSILYAQFCGTRTGAIALGQEQDSVLGGYDASQTPNVIIDTFAIYNTAWSSSDVPTNKAVGVDLSTSDLWALYSGYTRGRDLVGFNDATLRIYQFANGMPNDDANSHTLDMLSPHTVGGIAWDFPAGQTTHYFGTETDFEFPSGSFTIEMWIKIHDTHTGRYFVSFASSTSDNCLLSQMSGFDSDDIDVWRHFVIVYDDANDETIMYKDGVEDSSLMYSGFCGDTTGSLVIGQEQDSVGGSFSSGQSADMAIDTIAIYSSAWSSDDVNARGGECVNLQDASLWTVWSGFTRGKDLIGNNDAAYFSIDSWVDGAELSC